VLLGEVGLEYIVVGILDWVSLRYEYDKKFFFWLIDILPVNCNRLLVCCCYTWVTVTDYRVG
jgi:hypothetical protein